MSLAVDFRMILRKLTPLAVWMLVYVAMVGVGYIVQVPGSDWVHHWQPRYEINSYPPWVLWLLALLPDLPYLTGLTLTILAFCLWKRKARIWHWVAAFTALPLYWTLWLGQIDAVPLLGLQFLPWGIPLVMLKPQLGFWYTWVWWRKQSTRWWILLGVVAFVLVTFAIWGFWPARFTQPASYRTAYDLSAWRIHWALGVVFLVGAILESDPERSMALGALAAPYVQGASYIVLLPSLIHLRGWVLGLVWLTSWFGVAALFFGDTARIAAILFPISLWTALAWQAYHARQLSEKAIPEYSQSQS